MAAIKLEKGVCTQQRNLRFEMRSWEIEDQKTSYFEWAQSTTQFKLKKNQRTKVTNK